MYIRMYTYIYIYIYIYIITDIWFIYINMLSINKDKMNME